MYTLDRDLGVLCDSNGRRFDLQKRSWIEAEAVPGEDVSSIEAVRWMQRDSGHPLRAPVSVIGPRDVNDQQYKCAEMLGAELAAMGLTVVCGGRSGIMEAVCRGVASKGGISIGILPDADPQLANSYVSVALATGIGEARNAIVARAGFCLVAVGNSYGTLSEVALGLQFEKPVFGILGAAKVDGVVEYEEPDDVIKAVADCALSVTR